MTITMLSFSHAAFNCTQHLLFANCVPNQIRERVYHEYLALLNKMCQRDDLALHYSFSVL